MKYVFVELSKTWPFLWRKEVLKIQKIDKNVKEKYKTGKKCVLNIHINSKSQGWTPPAPPTPFPLKVISAAVQFVFIAAFLN